MVDLPDVRHDLDRYDRRGASRTYQVRLGPSDVGRCLRQAAYRHHHIPPTDERSRGVAQLGILLHLGWSGVVAAAQDPERVADVKIQIPGGIRGTADEVNYRDREVVDLKTGSARAFERWVTYGLPDHMWDQVELYAYGLVWMDYVGPWTLVIVALNRETGEDQRFERPADLQRGERLAEMLVTKQDLLDVSASPDEFAREGAGPGRGFPCDYCDWMTDCWNIAPDYQPGGLSPQAGTIVDDPAAIAGVLEDYLTAGEEVRKHEKAQKDARAFLSGLPAGQYGDKILKWQGGRDLGPEDDPDAAVALLREIGIPIPQRRRTSARSIRVLRATVTSTSASRAGSPGEPPESVPEASP